MKRRAPKKPPIQLAPGLVEELSAHREDEAIRRLLRRSNPRAVTLTVNAISLGTWRARAEAAGVPLVAWIERQLDDAVERGA